MICPRNDDSDGNARRVKSTLDERLLRHVVDNKRATDHAVNLRNLKTRQMV